MRTERKRILKTFSGSALLTVLLIAFAVTGCGGKPEGYYYLVAAKFDGGPELFMKLTLVRKFEKQNWCEAEKESLVKRDFAAECRYQEVVYEPMFQAKPAGVWYVLQRIGRFSPTVLIYEFTPPLTDELMLQQLRYSAPHVLKFAALHKAPAQVQIISPDGTLHSVSA